jgi:hypothetical protein
MPHGQGEPPSPDPQAQARDWITIWQSELTALATDREAVDAWTRLVTLWAETAERAARLLPGAGAPDGAAGRAGSAAPAGAAAPVAAPDARDATIQHLANRVAELERRLALIAEGSRGPNA